MKLLTDTEMLDFLQANCKLPVNVVCRDSVTGRGWRLHETSAPGYDDVRKAIRAYIADTQKEKRLT